MKSFVVVIVGGEVSGFIVIGEIRSLLLFGFCGVKGVVGGSVELLLLFFCASNSEGN